MTKNTPKSQAKEATGEPQDGKITRSGEVRETPPTPSTASPAAEAVKTEEATLMNPDLLKENEELKARAKQAEQDLERAKKQLEAAQKNGKSSPDDIDAANARQVNAEREAAAVAKEREKLETVDVTLLRDMWMDAGVRTPKGTRVEHMPKKEALANIRSGLAIRTEDLAAKLEADAEARAARDAKTAA